MSRLASWFCRTAVLLCNVAAMSFLYGVTSFKETGNIQIPGLYIWIACIIACSFVLSLLSGKERSVRLLIAVNAVFFVIQCILSFVFISGYATVEGVLFSILFWLLSYYRCYSMVKNGVKQEQSADGFDLSVVILLLSIACGTMSTMGRNVMYLPAIAAVLSLAGLICARASGGRERGDGRVISGSSLVVFAVLVIAGGAVGLIVLLAEPLRNGIKAVLSALLTAVKWVAETLTSLLVRALPESDRGDALLGDLGAGTGGEGAASDYFFEVDWIPRFIVIAIIAAVVIFVVVRFVLGGKRGHLGTFGRASVKKTYRKSRTLREVFSAFSARVRYFFDTILHRNTARGLFAWLLKRGRAVRMPRGKGETPRAYLMRISEVYPQNREPLHRLADILDEEFFSDGGCHVSAHEAASMRRTLVSGFAAGPVK